MLNYLNITHLGPFALNRYLYLPHCMCKWHWEPDKATLLQAMWKDRENWERKKKRGEGWRGSHFGHSSQMWEQCPVTELRDAGFCSSFNLACVLSPTSCSPKSKYSMMVCMCLPAELHSSSHHLCLPLCFFLLFPIPAFHSLFMSPGFSLFQMKPNVNLKGRKPNI